MFDLHLEKYSISELHELLQLQQPCTIQDVYQNCDALKSSIHKDTTLDETKREEVIVFLNNLVVKLKTHYEANLYDTTVSAYQSNSHELTGNELSNTPHEQIREKPQFNDKQVSRNYRTLYPAGERDPLYRETINHVVSIDSKFRKQYYRTQASDFHMVLNTPIKNVVSMTLNAMELPNSMFPISRDTGNNYLYIKDDTDTEYRTVEIPNGQYTFDAIVNVLMMAINNLGGVYADYQVGHSDEPVNARIVIRSSVDGTGGKFRLKFFDAENPDMNLLGTLGWILGFRINEYTGNDVYAGEGLYDGGGVRYLLMRIDDFNKNTNDYFVSNYTHSILKDNILARIQLRVPTYTINYNTASDLISRKREYFGPVTIERLHIQLLNEYGQVIDLNNMDYSFALELECLR